MEYLYKMVETKQTSTTSSSWKIFLGVKKSIITLSLRSAATVELFFLSFSVILRSCVLCLSVPNTLLTCRDVHKSTSAIELSICSLFLLLYFSVQSLQGPPSRTRAGQWAVGHRSSLVWSGCCRSQVCVCRLRLLMKQLCRRKEKARCCGFIWYHAMRLLLLHLIQRQTWILLLHRLQLGLPFRVTCHGRWYRHIQYTSLLQ